MPRNRAALLALTLGWAGMAEAAPDGAAIYAVNCSVCRGGARLGGTGPALLPDNLGRLKPAQATEVSRGGRAQTCWARPGSRRWWRSSTPRPKSCRHRTRRRSWRRTK